MDNLIEPFTGPDTGYTVPVADLMGTDERLEALLKYADFKGLDNTSYDSDGDIVLEGIMGYRLTLSGRSKGFIRQTEDRGRGQGSRYVGLLRVKPLFEEMIERRGMLFDSIDKPKRGITHELIQCLRIAVENAFPHLPPLMVDEEELGIPDFVGYQVRVSSRVWGMEAVHLTVETFTGVNRHVFKVNQ